jgi:DNA-binding NarL/FixJ family response regulator
MTESDAKTNAFRPIKVLLAGPRLEQTHAFDHVLVGQSGFMVIGDTGDAAHASKNVARLRPDVVMLRAFTPSCALEAICMMLMIAPNAKLLVVTNSFSLDEAILILEYGACGVIASRDACQQGLRALRGIYDGQIWASRSLLSRIVSQSIKHASELHARDKSSPNLTERESQIIRLLRSGASNKIIASSLSISNHAVKSHVQNIFGKLNVHRRHQILPALGAHAA